VKRPAPLLAALLLAAPAIAGSSLDAAIGAADKLAPQARALPQEPPEPKKSAVDSALKAYAAIIARRPKDAKLVPRIRRRRASLLKHAGRTNEALQEYDAILKGRARRKDRAKAHLEAAKLLERKGDLQSADRRLKAAIEDYRDIVRVRAQAALARGRIQQALGHVKLAERCYRHVIGKCRDQAKAAIEAYDALALMAIAKNDAKHAARWLKRCAARYEKQATRKDKYGAMIARLLAGMKAPAALAQAQSAPPPKLTRN